MPVPPVDLAQALRALLDDGRAAELSAIPTLAAVLTEALATARATWPTVAVSDHRFVGQLATALSASDDAALLPQLRFSDLYLTAACADGDRAAIELLTTRYRADLAAALRQIGLPASQIDELIQDLWQTLLVGPADGRARIADYRGRGDLHRWLRASALRAAYKHLERSGRSVALDDDLAAVPAGGLDPEMDYLKRRYAAEFRDALHAAIAGLEPRQRALLRRHHLDGMSVDELGALHRVHRSTAARWVADARQVVLRATRRELQVRLRLAEAEMSSLLGFVQSQLDVSIERVLASTGAAPAE